MIGADRLHNLMLTVSRDIERLGASTWQRFDDWAKRPEMARDILRGGGVGDGKTADRLEDERLDRQAAGYQDELDRLTRRVEADLSRLRSLMVIANPDSPRPLRHTDLSAAQLAVDGWCPSCFRNARRLEPIAKGRYTDRCRGCGEIRGRERRDPTMEELRLMHSRGKSLPHRVA